MIQIYKVRSENLVADCLTKGQGLSLQNRLRSASSLLPSIHMGMIIAVDT